MKKKNCLALLIWSCNLLFLLFLLIYFNISHLMLTLDLILKKLLIKLDLVLWVFFVTQFSKSSEKMANGDKIDVFFMNEPPD